MDPLSAVQVASAVIGIVDFGTRLLSDTYEIYQSASGRKERDVELSTLSDDLARLGQALQDRLDNTSSPSSASESTVRSLAGRCVEASAKLEAAIDALQAKASSTSKISTAASSFVSALKGIWKKGEIEALKENLTDIRSQMTLAVLVSVWEETKKDDQRHFELKDRLDLIASKLDKNDDPVRDFAHELGQMTTQRSSKAFNHKNEKLTDVLWGVDWRSWAANHHGDLFEGSPQIQRRILNSLSFRGMQSREEAIPEAYENTFSWIFQDDQVDPGGQVLEWSSFLAWLKQKNDGLYWITGKPGSGKSTLMKYIFQNPQLIHHLEDYAGDAPLELAGFFFWNPGTELEKSREGLLRSLLHQCLERHQDLIPVVTPRRWALYNISDDGADAPEWTWQELNDSFEILCSYHGQKFQLALFIDGLDEFIDAEKSPGILLSWIKGVAKHDIKVCVSSRPWNVFSDAFATSPSLTMQALTRRDIEHFVRVRFSTSLAFEELSAASGEATERLLMEIIEKAEGVFLWVNLVVRSLLETLVDTPSLSLLQAQLDEIPTDISGMYDAIWRSIPPARLAQTSMIFQICCIETDSLGFMPEVVWFATDKSAILTQQVVDDPRSYPPIRKIVKRILSGTTRGICELSVGEVQFLHRSAPDWMKNPSTWAEICSKSPPDFEANLNFAEALIQWLPVGRVRDQWDNSIWPEKMHDLFSCLANANRQNRQDMDSLHRRIFQAVEDVQKITYDASQGIWPKCTHKISMSPEIFDHFKTSDKPVIDVVADSADVLFAVYAAAYGLDAYVKTKLETTKNLLVPNPNTISILEGAVTQTDSYPGDRRTHMRVELPSENLEGRLEIVRFILETGRYRHTVKRTGDGRRLSQVLTQMRRGGGGETRRQSEFFDEIERLLRVHGFQHEHGWGVLSLANVLDWIRYDGRAMAQRLIRR